MRNLNNGIGCVPILALSILIGCVSSKAPHNFLPNPEDVPTEINGGWIEIGLDSPSVDYMGELIAVDNDSVHVLTDAGLRSTRVDSVWRARLFYYNSHWGEFAALTTLGFLSTASHGFYAPLTSVMWLIVGVSSSSVRSRQPMIMYTIGHDKPELWDRIRSYSRFPQGLPKVVAKNSL
jgi:hypothetical protein